MKTLAYHPAMISIFCAVAFHASAGIAAPPSRGAFSNPAVRAARVAELRERSVRRKAEAEVWAAQHGLRVRFESDGTLYELMRVEDGAPVYYQTLNVNAAISSAANVVRNTAPYNVNGSGLTVGVWDGGSVLHTHQEFGGRVTVKDGASSHYHSTHVGGTIGAAGVDPNALGMVPSVNVDSYDWNNDDSEMSSRGASIPGGSGKIYISNHSYGQVQGWAWGEWVSGYKGWYWFYNITTMYDMNMGRYTSLDRDWDDIAYKAPYYLICKSAGNDRTDKPNNGDIVYYFKDSSYYWIVYDNSIHPLGDGEYKSGYDCIPQGGVAKNILTIGAVDDAVSGGSRYLPSATMAAFSSWGPADDGRIKPDVVGNGMYLYSTDHDNDFDYLTISGTSMSSPNVCGSATLLVDYYDNLHPGSAMRSSTLKGLIIHTADNLGNPGPDYSYGWGMMNTEAAADIISKDAASGNACITEEYVNASNPSRQYTFDVDGTEEFKATLCWTDPPGTVINSHDDRTPKLVNDLDLRITDPSSSTHYPYKLDYNSPGANATTGDNIRDNVEQVVVAAGATPGTYTVTVSYKGSLTYGNQYFSLIISGATSGGGTIPAPPTGVSASDGTYNNKVAVSWNASSGATKYMVYRNTSDNSAAASTVSGELTGTSFDDTGVTAGQTNYYWVKAGNGAGWSGFSASDSGYASGGATLAFHAVIVGISDYEGTVNDLDYCDDDAQAIYDRLKASSNWSAANMQLLLDSAATEAAIQSAIQSMATSASTGDVCLVYLSGHGGQTGDVAPYDETDGYDELFCPYNISTEQVLDDELSDWLRLLPTDKVIVWIDSCYSGGNLKHPAGAVKCVSWSTGAVGKGDGFLADFKDRRRDVDDLRSPYISTACDDTELSVEMTSLQHGLYTYYLLEALNSADANSNGWVSCEETFTYLYQKVVDTNADQHPQQYDAYPGEAEVVDPSSATSHEVRISDATIKWKYKPKGTKAKLTAKGLDIQTSLSTYLEQGYKIGLKDAATLAILDGPHELSKKTKKSGEAKKWYLIRRKDVVIKYKPKTDKLVYKVWGKTDLPAQVVVFLQK